MAPLACSNYGNGNWKKKNLNTTITAISVSAGIIFKNPFYNYDWENTNLQHKFLSYFFFHFVLIKSRYTIHIINPLSVLFLIHQLVLSTPASISFACDVYFNLLFQTYLRNFLFDCNCDDLELSIASMIALNSTPLLCICFILFFQIHCCWHVTCCCKKFFCLVFRWVTYTLWYIVYRPAIWTSVTRTRHIKQNRQLSLELQRKNSGL